MVPLSILDLAPVTEGSTPARTFANSLDLARHAERLGYRRYWLAEHHNMPGIASAATAVLIGHVAAGTSSIRVGSGGDVADDHRCGGAGDARHVVVLGQPVALVAPVFGVAGEVARVGERRRHVGAFGDGRQVEDGERDHGDGSGVGEGQALR